MLPATISVAPNSPSALAKERMAPAMMPLFAIGIITLSAVLSSVWPSVKRLR